jgi:hypothetical protein
MRRVMLLPPLLRAAVLVVACGGAPHRPVALVASGQQNDDGASDGVCLALSRAQHDALALRLQPPDAALVGRSRQPLLAAFIGNADTSSYPQITRISRSGGTALVEGAVPQHNPGEATMQSFVSVYLVAPLPAGWRDERPSAWRLRIEGWHEASGQLAGCGAG